MRRQPRDADGLSRLERDVLLVIQELLALDGYGPSLIEIAHEVGCASKGNIHRVLAALRRRGFIEWLPRHHRSIRVLRPIPMPEEPEIVGRYARPAPVRHIPHLGRVA